MSKHDHDRDTPVDDPLLDAVKIQQAALHAVADHLDEIGGSLKGIHRGIGDMDRGIKVDIAELTQLVNGLAANVRTALSVVPNLNDRLRAVEVQLGLAQPNGAASDA